MYANQTPYLSVVRVCLLASALALPALAGPRNLIRNGDFESNLPGKLIDFWMPTPPYPATYEVIADPARAHSGAHYLRLTPTRAGSDGNLYQFVAKVEGAGRYVAALWARGQGSSIRVFLYRYGPDLKFLESRHSPAVTLTDQWQECRLEYQLEPEVRNLACAIHVFGGPADIDDIAVHSADTQPPALPAVQEKPWRGNTLGRDHSVPAPFTPLEVTGDTGPGQELQIECWGRSLRWRDGLLPAQITSQGEDLLARPLQLLAAVADRSLDLTPGTSRVTSRFPDRVTVEARSSSAGPLGVTATAAVEFDGLVRIDLSLTAATPLTLARLSVEIPLDPAQAQLCYRHGGKRENDYGSAPASACNWAFGPTLWFGNHARGLCWFAESSAGWSNADPGRVIEWLPTEKTRTLRINLVDAPYRLEGSRTFTFGLLPTPCKRPPGKSQDHTVRGGPADPRYTRVLYLNTSLQGDPLQYHFSASRREEIRKFVASAGKAGQRIAAWMQLELVRAIPGYEEHFAKWQRVPGETYPPDYVYLCPGSEWADLLLYSLAELQQQYRLDGYYFDTGSLEECANRQHGCGVASGTEVTPTYPIFAIHEFKQRLYRVLVERLGPDRAYISSLVNGHMDLACLTFDTAAVSGEEWMGQARDDYGAVSTLAQFGVKYDPGLWGLWHVWLPAMTASHSRATTDTLLNLALLHNTPLWIEFVDRERVHSVLDALAAFGVRDCRFLFPWDCRRVVTLSGGRCEVAMHVAGDRALLVLANPGAEAVRAELTVDWAAAGLVHPPARYEDVLSHEVLSAVAGTLPVPVGAKTFRLIAARGGW